MMTRTSYEAPHYAVFFRHFLHLRSKYSPQQSVLKQTHSLFCPLCEEPSFTTIRNNGYYYSFVYLQILYINQCSLAPSLAVQATLCPTSFRDTQNRRKQKKKTLAITA
jgi:hypothetical protein